MILNLSMSLTDVKLGPTRQTLDLEWYYLDAAADRTL
jgi:hypothetical protein